MTDPVDINVLSHIAAELVELRSMAESFQRLLAGHTYIEARGKLLLPAELTKKLDDTLSRYKAAGEAAKTSATALRAAAGLAENVSDDGFIAWLREAAALRSAVRRGAA